MISPEQLAETIRLLPDLVRLQHYLERNIQEILLDSYPEQSRTPPAPELLHASDTLKSLGVSDPAQAQEQARKLVDSGKQALDKLRENGTEAVLAPEEETGLEAIVLIAGRPAILIQNGQFIDPPVGWEVLEERREPIERTFQSVGRIEVDGHPALDWVGTGFLVADNVIMTNRHVAKAFCYQEHDTWVFEPGMVPRIDFVEDLGAMTPAEFRLTDVIGVHDILDMALLQVDVVSSNGVALPPPLPLAAHPPEPATGHQVYIVGYPAWDGKRNDPEQMRRLFSRVFGVKRLQPGEILEVFHDTPVFTHDCSTLGGNSGSCVVDLETHQVLGLHYSGRYLKANRAIALWELQHDPLIQRANIAFQ